MKPNGPKTPDGGPKADQSPTVTPSVGQIPMSDQPLPPPPSSGPEEGLTLERVLGNPTWAEDQLYGHLTLRALRWLDLLERDEGTPPEPGKKVVSLDTQVEMFKVIAEWLKTSKKTKSEGVEEGGAPGIEQMRELIREELSKVPEDERPTGRARVEDDDDYDDEDPEPPTLPIAKAAVGRLRAAVQKRVPQSGRNVGQLVQRPTDSSQLDIMIQRAREAALKEDD